MTDKRRADETGESIIVECELPEPPEKVWRALTEPELLARWLLPNDMRPEPGRRFTFKAQEAQGGDIACEVLAAKRPRELRYSWRAKDGSLDDAGRPLDTVVTFTLTET
jgi:uncharacterized protein YndB with AHSA1/START domain